MATHSAIISQQYPWPVEQNWLEPDDTITESARFRPSSWVGITKPVSSLPPFFTFFRNFQFSGYILNIMFISDRCRRSHAASTPVKYERWFKASSSYFSYRQVSNIRRTLVGNEIVVHSDVVGASPVGAAPTNIFILHLTPGCNILRKDNCKPRRETFEFWDLVRLILEIWW